MRSTSTSGAGQAIVHCSACSRGGQAGVGMQCSTVCADWRGCRSAAANGLPLQHYLVQIPDSVGLRQRIQQQFELAALPGTKEADMRRALHFVVVGGGPTGEVCEPACVACLAVLAGRTGHAALLGSLGVLGEPA